MCDKLFFEKQKILNNDFAVYPKIMFFARDDDSRARDNNFISDFSI